MFKSANTIGALPLLEERLSWLPVDEAGRSISEIVMSSLTLPEHSTLDTSVFHIVNPRLADWSDILDGLRQGGLAFETVERRNWLERLAKSDPDVLKNPTYKLLVGISYKSHSGILRTVH